MYTYSLTQEYHLLGVYPREMKKYVHSKTCIWVFTVDLLIKIKKNPKHLGTTQNVHQLTNRRKLWYIHTMAYNSAINKQVTDMHNTDEFQKHCAK